MKMCCCITDPVSNWYDHVSANFSKLLNLFLQQELLIKLFAP